MNKDNRLALAFTLWALVVTVSFLWANGGQMAAKLAERLGSS